MTLYIIQNITKLSGCGRLKNTRLAPHNVIAVTMSWSTIVIVMESKTHEYTRGRAFTKAGERLEQVAVLGLLRWRCAAKKVSRLWQPWDGQYRERLLKIQGFPP